MRPARWELRKPRPHRSKPRAPARQPSWHFRRPGTTCPINFGDTPQAWVHCTCGQLKSGSTAEVEAWWSWHRAHPGEEPPTPSRQEKAAAWVEALPGRVNTMVGSAGAALGRSLGRVRVAPGKAAAVAAEVASVGGAAVLVAAFALDVLLASQRGVPDETVSWYEDDVRVERHGRWWHYFDATGRLFKRLPVLTGAATITANTGANSWNTNGCWVGSVQPGASDDVVLPASAVVTIPSGVTALCRSINVQASATIAWAATTSNLNVGDSAGGAVTFSSTCTVTLTGVGTINFLSTQASTTFSLTSGGKTLPNVTVNTGTTTTIRCADAMTAKTVTLTQGKFDTNGQTCNWVAFVCNVANTRTLTMGNSAISVSSTATGWNMVNPTGLTITANTAVITISGNTATWTVASVDYNGASVVITGSGIVAVGGLGASSKVANFTRTGTAAKGDGVTFSGQLTVTGTCTFNSNSAVNRLLVSSSVVGTQRTLNCTGATVVIDNTAAASGSSVDFMDITITGSPTWTVNHSTLVGDCGGNGGAVTTNVTAPATQTHTASAGGNWSDVTKWTSRVPLPQDNVVVDVNTTGTLTADMPRLGASIDFTGFVGTGAFNSIANTVFGSITLASGMTFTSNQPMTIGGRSSFTMTSAGKSFGGTLTQNGPGGTYTQQDAFVQTGVNSLTGTNGTWTTNNNALTVGALNVAANAETFNGGTSIVTLTRTDAIAIFSGGANTSAASATFIISAASTNTRTFAGGGNTYGTLTYTVAGSTGTLVITGANTFATLNFSDASAARTLTLPASTTTKVTTFNVNGTSGNLMSIVSSTGGTPATLSVPSGSVICDYVSIMDSHATGGAVEFYATHATDATGNTGWAFNPTALAAALTAQADVAGTNTQTIALTATLTASSAVAATSSEQVALAVTVAPSTTVAGTSTESAVVAATLTVSAAVAGTNAETVPLVVAVAASAALVAGNAETVAVDAALTATGSVVAANAEQAALAANVTSSCAVEALNGATVALSAEVDSSTVVAGTMTEADTLAATLSASALIAAANTETGTLSASATMDAAFAGTNGEQVALAAAVTAAATLAGAQTEQVALTAALIAASTVGANSGVLLLAAAVSAQVALTATNTTTAALIAELAATLAVAGYVRPLPKLGTIWRIGPIKEDWAVGPTGRGRVAISVADDTWVADLVGQTT